MKLIEIVRGLATSDETFRISKELSLKLGKTPLEANDFPGFISSRLIFSLMNEAIYALYEGVGKAEEIDAIMKMGANHPMGPLEIGRFCWIGYGSVRDEGTSGSIRGQISALPAPDQVCGCRIFGEKDRQRDSIIMEKRDDRV